MSVATKLTAFAAVLLVAFVVGFGLGGRFDPIVHETPTATTVMDHGSGMP